MTAHEPCLECKVWQHPFVNLFKHLNVSEWKKSTKEGDVVTIMERSLKCTVYRITGSIPASNYLQLPKTSSQSLGLTGRYLYILLKPIPGKYFVVHLDVATQDGLVVRISFSNLFKEFKSTSTWLQFPFICQPAKRSVEGITTKSTRKDTQGPAPAGTRWTLLLLDFQYILSMYLNRKYTYLKSVRLCANLFIKNLFTTDTQYEPGITVQQARAAGLIARGVAPLPREMSFPVPKGHVWHDHYDYIRFPSAASKVPFDSMQSSGSVMDPSSGQSLGKISPQRVSPQQVHISKAVNSRVSLINKLTTPRKSHKKPVVVSQLPKVGLDSTDDMSVIKGAQGEVHVFANSEDDVTLHRHGNFGLVTSTKLGKPTKASLPPKQSHYKGLKPDPIMSLRSIIGFGGCTTTQALWTANGTHVIYPCHAVVVSMDAISGHQRFFIGHTDKISSLSFNKNTTLLASAQTGQQSVVRVWKYQSAECLAMFKTHVHGVYCLSFSQTGDVLCGVGKDGHGKNMVVVWDTSRVIKRGEVSVMAKAHSDLDIVNMKISPYDRTRMVSCGRDNVRIWRVRNGSLRSAPVTLGEFHTADFTDLAFEVGSQPGMAPADKIVYACTQSGHIFEIDYDRVSVTHIRRLLPTGKEVKEKGTFKSGAGLAINTICVNESFCVTGSDDGYLRLWPLDFKNIFLEAEHEGPVTAVGITQDGLRILAGTSTGNLGMLDISTRQYTTLMRSHTQRVLAITLDPMRRHLATVSEDHTIRIWDLDTLQQLFDFNAPQECPCCIAYHPSLHCFACGFDNGCVRVFSVANTSLVAELRQHRGKVTGLVYTPNSNYLISSCSVGTLALYDASQETYPVARLLGNMVAKGERYGPDALGMSGDGKHVAFVGPSEFTVTVVDARSLDEVLRVDISSLGGDTDGPMIDTATKVCYAPPRTKQLLVTTSNSHLLRLDARSGRLLNKISNVHRSDVSSLHVCNDCRHLATAGDKVVKIWDFHMRLDLNFQGLRLSETTILHVGIAVKDSYLKSKGAIYDSLVDVVVFIGHCDTIQQLRFTPDKLGLVTIGDAIFLWDFHGAKSDTQPIGSDFDELPTRDTDWKPSKSPVRRSLDLASSLRPRDRAPKPTTPIRLTDISSVQHDDDDDDMDGADTSDAVLIGPELQSTSDRSSPTETDEPPPAETLGFSARTQPHRVASLESVPQPESLLDRVSSQEDCAPSQSGCGKPNCYRHFVAKCNQSQMAQRRYIAPPNQSGLRLKTVLGYNGNGRSNMIWHPETGLFAYTSGCVIVMEDLQTGTQKHLMGHVEEISTLALQHDAQALASASGSHGLASSQICLWDIQGALCKKVLSYHEHDIVCLAYSRDDRFLISVGDYRDCTLVVWCTNDYGILAASKTACPIHHLSWDPYTTNEFASVGERGTILFWLLDETQGKYSLNVHEASVPEELMASKPNFDGEISFTYLQYGGDSVLYAGANTGVLSAWDTRHNSCFMHWEADTAEIGMIVSRFGSSRLITGSGSNLLRLWSVYGVGELRLAAVGTSVPGKGLVMEDEMLLDGAVTSAEFDDTLDIGIVGTTAGTLWYINWLERSSVRLASRHSTKVNALAFSESDFFASCANDGSLRLYSIDEMEQTLQFQVLDQSCNCMAFTPVLSTPSLHPLGEHPSEPDAKRLQNIVAGYSDGTVRLFDLCQVEMILKMQPHAVAVTAIKYSSDGHVIISGGSDGLIAISSPTTGMTMRVINDHKGAPITDMDVTKTQDAELAQRLRSPHLWLAASADRRVSVWSADWPKDFCEMVDWLSFPAPAFTPDGTVISKGDIAHYQSLPPSLARFSSDPDVVIYAGYGMQKQIQFYSISQKKVIRTAALTHWVTSLDLSPKGHLIVTGTNERLIKLMDYHECSFQDFVAHNDSVQLVRFAPSGKLVFSVAHNEILVWKVTV